jgi:hypothetical protein
VNRRWIAIVIVLVVILGAWWWIRRVAAPGAEVDLVAQFDTAAKRSSPLPPEQAFTIEDVTIDGETRRSIVARPTSRITWKLAVPMDGWLRTALALKPETWGKEGDGALFRIGVSDGRSYEELVNQHIDPHSRPEDRRWFPIELDLTTYGGNDVELIFNINSSLPKRGDDTRNDLPVWGQPEIYVRR